MARKNTRSTAGRAKASASTSLKHMVAKKKLLHTIGKGSLAAAVLPTLRAEDIKVSGVRPRIPASPVVSGIAMTSNIVWGDMDPRDPIRILDRDPDDRVMRIDFDSKDPVHP
jgi:hypothetical protein